MLPYVYAIFSTGHDEANREAFLQKDPENLQLVGLALRGPKKSVDNAGIKRKFNDERLQKNADLEDDVHTFNIRYKLGIRSPKAMYKLNAWAQRYQVQFSDVRRALPYFCTNSLTFKIPAENRSNLKWFMPILLGVLYAIAISCLVNPYASITVKKTGTLMWVRPGEAHSFNSPLPNSWGGAGAWTTSKPECLLVASDYPVGNNWDKDVACNLIMGRHDKYLKSAVSAQRQGATSLLVGLTIPVVPFLLAQRRKANAKRLKQTVDEAK